MRFPRDPTPLFLYFVFFTIFHNVSLQKYHTMISPFFQSHPSHTGILRLFLSYNASFNIKYTSFTLSNAEKILSNISLL